MIKACINSISNCFIISSFKVLCKCSVVFSKVTKLQIMSLTEFFEFLNLFLSVFCHHVFIISQFPHFGPCLQNFTNSCFTTTTCQNGDSCQEGGGYQTCKYPLPRWPTLMRYFRVFLTTIFGALYHKNFTT